MLFASFPHWIPMVTAHVLFAFIKNRRGNTIILAQVVHHCYLYMRGISQGSSSWTNTETLQDNFMHKEIHCFCVYIYIYKYVYIYIYVYMCVCVSPTQDLPFSDVLSIFQKLGEHSTHNIICINGWYITSNIYIFQIYIYIYIYIRSNVPACVWKFYWNSQKREKLQKTMILQNRWNDKNNKNDGFCKIIKTQKVEKTMVFAKSWKHQKLYLSLSKKTTGNSSPGIWLG